MHVSYPTVGLGPAAADDYHYEHGEDDQPLAESGSACRFHKLTSRQQNMQTIGLWYRRVGAENRSLHTAGKMGGEWKSVANEE